MFTYLQSVSKFDYKDFLNRFQNFYNDMFPTFASYWTLPDTPIDPTIVKEFEWLQSQIYILISDFRNVAVNTDYDTYYFDFMQTLDDIRTIIETIYNYPKYIKVSNNYIDVFKDTVINYFVQQGDTPESIAYKFYGDTEKSNDIMMYNGLRYIDVDATNWVGTLLKIPIRTAVQTQIDIPGVIDVMAGDNMLGKDIDANFAFVNDDIATVNFQDCVLQSVGIILSVSKGSVPQYPQLGTMINQIIGQNLGALSLPFIASELKSLFGTDQTIKALNITNIAVVNDSAQFSLNFQLANDGTIDENELPPYKVNLLG